MLIRILAIIGVAALALAATNPSREAFEDWARIFVTKKVEVEARKQGVDLTGENASWAAATVELWVVHMSVERQNLLVASLYDVMLPPEGQTNGEQHCRVLGIAGQFVPVSGC